MRRGRHRSTTNGSIVVNIEYFRDRSDAECKAAINVLSNSPGYDSKSMMVTALKVLIGSLSIEDTRARSHPTVILAFELRRMRVR